jgi:hypothetical protein
MTREVFLKNWKFILLMGEVSAGLVATALFLFLRWWEPKHGRIDGVKEPRNYLKEWFSGLKLLASVTIVSYTMVVTGPYLERGVDSALKHVGLRLTQLLICLVVIALGGIVYIFKLLSLKWYGRIEIIFAASTAVITVRQITSQPNWLPILATLGGCVYVVARGFSNTSEAKKNVWLAKNKKRDEDIDRMAGRREWEREWKMRP